LAAPASCATRSRRWRRWWRACPRSIGRGCAPIQAEIGVITDFSGASTNSQGQIIQKPGEGDKLNLSFIDANVNLAGDQAFTLVQGRFSGKAGEAYSKYDPHTEVTSLFLDVNGDAIADTTIHLLGHVNLTAADFIL
jgi:hypothetical protein